MGKMVLVALGIFLSSYSAQAISRVFFDVDGPVFYAKKFNANTPGVFGTPVRLFKIRNRPNTWVQTPTSPDVIEVSISDLDSKLSRFNVATQQYETLLSPKEGRFGSLQKLKLNNIEFIPGFYYIKVPESFEYFHEGANGQNYLLQAYQNARELDRKNLGTYKGRYMSVVQELLSNKDSAETLGFISSRSHTRKEWDELGEEWIRDGETKYKADPSNIHMVGRAEDYQEYGIEVDDIESRKIDVLRQAGLEMADVPLTDADYVLNPSGDGMGQYHVLHYIENDQRIFMRAVKELRALATMRMHGKRIPLKIILSNAGDDWQVEQSRLPRHIVLDSNGPYREARVGEISDKFFEADGKKIKRDNKKEHKTGNDSLQCSKLFQ